MAVILMKEILSELHCIYCLCMCIPYSHYQKITTTTTKTTTTFCVCRVYFFSCICVFHVHRFDANCITSHTMYVDFVAYNVCHVLCTKGSALFLPLYLLYCIPSFLPCIVSTCLPFRLCVHISHCFIAVLQP